MGVLELGDMHLRCNDSSKIYMYLLNNINPSDDRHNTVLLFSGEYH